MTLKVLFAVVNVSLVIVYAFGSGLWVSTGGAVLIAAGGSCANCDSTPGGDCLAGQALGRAGAGAVPGLVGGSHLFIGRILGLK
jgi:hypothetical protein